MSKIFDYLTEMASIVSPSGNEGDMADYLESFCRKAGLPACRDAIGNLIVRREGTGKKIMLCAHMDTIGMMATYIEPSGHIRFANIGGLNHREILYAPVVFKNGTTGVIARDDATKPADLGLQSLFIDIGAADKAEAEAHISVGDTAAYSAVPFLSGKRVFGPYMDNRIGVAVLMGVMDELVDCDNDIYFVFSAQEEVGLRGARTAAYTIDPEYAIAVDVTDTGDNPDPKPKMAVKLGGGPAVKIMDRSVICHSEVVAALENCAVSSGIAFQREVLEAGGTDAGAIHVSREGVKTGAISIPERYIHTPSECVDLGDADGAVRLLKAFLENGI